MWIRAITHTPVALTELTPIEAHFPEWAHGATGYGATLWKVTSRTFSNYVLDYRVCLAPMRWKVRRWPYWVGFHPKGRDTLRRRIMPRGKVPVGKDWCGDGFARIV